MKNKHAVSLGKLGGLKGGPARAAALNPERRIEIASLASKARWDNVGCAAAENGGCFCTGACRQRNFSQDSVKWEAGDFPNQNPPFKDIFDKQSVMEDDPEVSKNCTNPQHNPPNMMVIRHGKRYRHVCPGCGFTVILRSPNIRL